MFRKIVSSLSFSPALVGQLGFYAKRLRKEEATRRVGLVFVALALVVQSLVVFQAPESANAAHPSDMVNGGLGLGSNRSFNNFMRPYDANTKYLKDIMNHFGITRSEITNTTFTSWKATSNKISWGHTNRGGATAVQIKKDSGATNVTTLYGRSQTSYFAPNTTVWGYVGYSQKMGWFAIMQSCGNLVTEKLPPVPIPPPVTPEPEPEPEPEPLPAEIELSKTGTNVSQGNITAQSSVARQNDRISFTITAKNTGGSPELVELKDDLGDVLEYSTLIDRGGGTFDASAKTLSWPDVNLQAGATEQRTFAVRVLDTIPATPTGQSDNSSYDCVMENTFQTASIRVPVSCAPPKVVEQVVTELPKTGPTENIIFGAVLLAVVSYFFFRSKQLGKEVRLIRRDLHTGTL